jgi:18S rRNA (guanine1575-N7)-methyltransferase
MQMISEAAMKCGFSGGLTIDYPNSTKAKKYYLCLVAGDNTNYTPPKGLTGDESEEKEERDKIQFSKKVRQIKQRDSNKPSFKSREWILKKKERQRRQGKDVKDDSKYSGRKRGPKF